MSITIQVAEKLANDIQLLSRVMPSACRLSSDAIQFAYTDTSVVSINRLARDIAADIGLCEYIFIIAYATQGTNTAGHIELSNSSKQVYIELESALRDRPTCLLATLIHEIAHKWLHIRNIKHIVKIDNERLTDACCVYLGFSHQMISGCQHESSSTEFLNGQQQTKTATVTYGYLRKDELLFARKLCEVYLNYSATPLDVESDGKVNRVFKSLARGVLTDTELPGNKVVHSIKDDVVELEYLLYITMQMLSRSVNEVLYESHSMLREQTFTTENDSNNPPNAFQRLCSNLSNESKYEQNRGLADKITTYNSSLKKLISSITTLEQDINRLRNRQNVTCPLCRKVLRFKIDSESATLRCPNCQYVFPVQKVMPDLLTTKHIDDNKKNFVSAFNRFFGS